MTSLLDAANRRAAVAAAAQAPAGRRQASAATEAIAFAEEACGIVLDDWQRWIVEHALSERADGTWSAFEVGLVCPRQNGKNFILEVVQLACIYLFGDETLVHSAHKFDTSVEHFNRLSGCSRTRRNSPTCCCRATPVVRDVERQGAHPVQHRSADSVQGPLPRRRSWVRRRQGVPRRGVRPAGADDRRADADVVDAADGAGVVHVVGAARDSTVLHAVRNRADGRRSDRPAVLRRVGQRRGRRRRRTSRRSAGRTRRWPRVGSPRSTSARRSARSRVMPSSSTSIAVSVSVSRRRCSALTICVSIPLERWADVASTGRSAPTSHGSASPSTLSPDRQCAVFAGRRRDGPTARHRRSSVIRTASSGPKVGWSSRP